MSAKRLTALMMLFCLLCVLSISAFAATPPQNTVLSIEPKDNRSYRLNTSSNTINRSNVNIWENTRNPSQRWMIRTDPVFKVPIIVSYGNQALALNINHSNNNCEMLDPRLNSATDCAIRMVDESAQGGANCYGIVLQYSSNYVLERTDGTSYNGANVYWTVGGAVGQQNRQLWYVWQNTD